ncbi:MAG: DNA integrity scanning diadenylate cyclase DisA [Coriobacteriia bacterium]|nr:DNA integrity scanning diadenylate cyclase DisA [Coriobacteriia bacterium]
MRLELEKVAPGTALREGLDYIIAARTGALIVIGEREVVEPLCNGGFKIETDFSAQRLYELAKMDGAIILDKDCGRILLANVHLVPDASLPTVETGMRHRTAQRVSRQTHALVISISQRREVVSLYLNGTRVTLEEIEVLLAKASQALQTLQRYRDRLDQMLERLTELEFEDLVTLGDLTDVIGRFELVQRTAHEVARYIAELGTEGRLVRMQAEELTATVDEDYLLVVRDYAQDAGRRKGSSVRAELSRLETEQLLEPTVIAQILGVGVTEPRSADDHLRPRGLRVLRRIPMLPASVVTRIVERYGTLQGVLAATVEDLDEVDGIGERRAIAIVDGLSRIKEHARG